MLIYISKQYDKIALEVVVEFINVNYEKWAELLKKCKSLNEYSQLIYKVRVRNEMIVDLTTAIEQCIKECSEEGILSTEEAFLM